MLTQHKCGFRKERLSVISVLTTRCFLLLVHLKKTREIGGLRKRRITEYNSQIWATETKLVERLIINEELETLKF